MINKNIFLFLMLFTTIFLGCTNNKADSTSETDAIETGIHFFKGNFKDALDKAKTENKLVFMDAYASWCGPCKAMQKNVFPDPLVGKVFDDKFVSVAYDMEIGEGLELSAKYPVKGYPTLLFLSPDGNIVRSELGGRDAAGLIALANEVKP
jgi:thioredoxin 1